MQMLVDTDFTNTRFFCNLTVCQSVTEPEHYYSSCKLGEVSVNDFMDLRDGLLIGPFLIFYLAEVKGIHFIETLADRQTADIFQTGETDTAQKIGRGGCGDFS